MNTYIEKAKQLLLDGAVVDANSLFSLAYDIYANQSNMTSEEYRLCHQELKKTISDLPFTKMDAISCTVNALCAQHEHSAFTAGFQSGAALILALVSGEM